MHTLYIALLCVLITLGIGLVAGFIWAVVTYVRVRSMNLLNKKLGGKSFVIITGSPEAVRQAYEVCIAIVSKVQQNQEAKVGIANEEPEQAETPEAK